MTNEVQDKQTETGIKINNIISALILMVMSWVGYNIEDMKKAISMMSTAVQLNQAYGVENRAMIKENKEEIHGIKEKIYSLEGAYKSWKK